LQPFKITNNYSPKINKLGSWNLPWLDWC